MHIGNKKIYLNLVFCILEINFTTLLNIVFNYMVSDIFKSNDEEYINYNINLFHNFIERVNNESEITIIDYNKEENYEIYCFIIHSLNYCSKFIEQQIIKSKEN